MKKDPIPAQEKAYHHGDLRKAILKTALELIEEGGMPALTLRAISSRLNVSHAAPVYHFANKADIVIALASEGFILLRESLFRASEGIPSPIRQDQKVQRLCLVGSAYLDFAISHPQHYSLMFGPDIDLTVPGCDGYLEQSNLALRELSIALEEDAARLGPKTLFSWSLVHGMAMLNLGPLHGRLSKKAMKGIQEEEKAILRNALQRSAQWLFPEAT
jgi:AcrR family transcriptional regulator